MTNKKKLIEVNKLVVGAGPTGSLLFDKLTTLDPAAAALVEGQDRPLGNLMGLHLVDRAKANQLKDVEFQGDFAKALVRWDKKWVDQEKVDWDHKDWLAKIPQWFLYLDNPKKVVKAFKLPDFTGKNVEWNSPIQHLERMDDSSTTLWRVETATKDFLTKEIYWTAGISAFQNIFGKIESQKYLVGNPLYQKEAADFRGGLSLELQIQGPLRFEDGLDATHLLALPIRHNGKLFLNFFVAEAQGEENWTVRTLAHIHQDALNDPKELLSMQKSIKRGIKNVLIEDPQRPLKFQEKWIVSDKIGGHVLGRMWLLTPGLGDGLVFRGDETLTVTQKGPGVGLDASLNPELNAEADTYRLDLASLLFEEQKLEESVNISATL